MALFSLRAVWRLVLRAGSQPGSESEGGDQPSAENSASSGSRSSSLDNPKKRSKKVRL